MWPRPIDVVLADTQFVLDENNFLPLSGSDNPAPLMIASSGTKSSVWTDSLAYPAYFAALSALVLVLQFVFTSKPVKKALSRVWSKRSAEDEEDEEEVDEEPPPVVSDAGLFGALKEHIGRLGGLTIFAYKVLRLLSCLALLGLSVVTLIQEESEDVHGASGVDALKKHHRYKKERLLSKLEWLQFALCLTFAYASLISLISISSRPPLSQRTNTHLVVLLLAVFAVFAYRDLYPLATYTLKPLDRIEGWLIWAKMAILAFAGVVIPLVIPRPYVPVDSQEPMGEPNPEQTAPILSLALYTFLDSIVKKAYSVPHLSYDQLPPLADYDYAKNLVKRSFPHLDTFAGAKKRYMFWGLLRVFYKEYICLALLILIKVISSFASPIGINKLLQYLETNGEGATVRPWVWVTWLFLGPLLGSIAMQWYIFITTGTLVRTEGIITQLVFEHALRIRMKAETAETASRPSSAVSSADVTAVPSPETGSINENEEHSDGSAQESPNGSGSEQTRVDRAASVSSKASRGKKKSKDEGKKPDSVKSQVQEQVTSKAGNLVGKINNLVTTDLNNLVDGRDFLFVVLYGPMQVALCIWFLYTILGWSAFVGLAVMVVLFPVPGYIAKLLQTVQTERMKKTDARVGTVTEIMNVLRMVKMFGWESKVSEQISEKREDELKLLWKRQLLGLLNGNINYIIPVAHMIVTFVTFTLIMKRELSASIVFSSMAVFDILREQLYTIFFMIPMFIQAKVSLDRVDEFLKDTELLDAFSADEEKIDVAAAIRSSGHAEDAIGFRDATFSWANDPVDGSLTPSKRLFRFRVEGELLFKPRSINLVIGPTGSGKTSLLMALLGEMHFIPSGPSSWFNLPRQGGVAYAAQESWVQNETIRDNILFGAPYDEKRYKKVIQQCALSRDLTLFEAGDKTEVGEKGLTLSGGQKARITLARAVYSSAEILLLDDVLAALDVHTSKHIVEKLFKGDLIKGRTVILLTHNVALASPVADFVVSLGTDGRVVSQGSVGDALAKDHALSLEVAEDTKAMKLAEDQVDSSEADEPLPENNKADGKLTVAEEIAVGHVSWTAIKLYLTGMGGNWPVLFWSLVMAALIACELSNTIQTWWLGYWAQQYTKQEGTVYVPFYLTVYVLLLLFAVLMYCVGYAIYYVGSIRASRTIHHTLINSILGTTLRWLDTTPTSRVIARCTQDIRSVDGPISQNLGALIEMTLTMLLRFAAVVVLTPIFMIPGVAVAVLGGWLGQIYIKAQLSVKREMSNARSPVLGHFGAAIAGLTSIRAYSAQDPFKKESMRRIDRYVQAGRTFYNLNRWICIRIDALGGLFAAGLAAYLIYVSPLSSASNAGFSLTMAVGFSGLILWWVRVLNQFEVDGNSLERIQQYISIEQEPKPAPSGVPPAYWPASGDLKVEGLSARYSPDGSRVLHELSFEIKSGERVGIVGRTGSGKSSLTLSLLRCIPTEGHVYYDGIATDSLNLEALRENITIIPQVPELLSGSLRQNLDPFFQYDDAILNDALRHAGLFSLQSEDDEGRITLDSQISSGGGNLSVGQRQILALARAIVRQSKVLILDEATSAIDYETDSIIQSSLRNQLKGDVTIITVAHRLQTIMDADKIMVLDAGKITEFGSPSELLKNDKGMLRALVDESNDRFTLYAMAAGAEQARS